MVFEANGIILCCRRRAVDGTEDNSGFSYLLEEVVKATSFLDENRFG